MSTNIKISLVFFLSLLSLYPVFAFPKVDPELTKALTLNPTTHKSSSSSCSTDEVRLNVFLTVKNGTNGVIQQHLDMVRTSPSSYETRGDQITDLYQSLVSHAQSSQAQLLNSITAAASKFSSSSSSSSSDSLIRIKSFWITNQIYIQNANRELIELFLKQNEVTSIDLEQIIQLEEFQPIPAAAAPSDNIPTNEEDNNVFKADRNWENFQEVNEEEEEELEQWNLELVHAREARRLANGSGVIVANIDTGVRATHEALWDTYKNDMYSWYDPAEGTLEPEDVQGHGTHTLGTILGNTRGIGIATGARWIACKAFNYLGQASQSDILRCGQFVMCPSHPDETNVNCHEAPHIVSNSWNSRDGSTTWFLDVVNAWHAAGIIPVFSAGNSGPDCRTLGAPAGEQVIAVGASTINETIAWFSSAGPSYKGEVKPDIVAPGLDVLSAFHTHDQSYARWTGTSMAAPHVAGAIALMLSHNETLNYHQIKAIIEQSADRNLSFAGGYCGGQPDYLFPNNHFGHGRLNVLNAMQTVLEGSNGSGGERTGQMVLEKVQLLYVWIGVGLVALLSRSTTTCSI